MSIFCSVQLGRGPFRSPQVSGLFSLLLYAATAAWRAKQKQAEREERLNWSKGGITHWAQPKRIKPQEHGATRERKPTQRDNKSKPTKLQCLQQTQTALCWILLQRNLFYKHHVQNSKCSIAVHRCLYADRGDYARGETEWTKWNASSDLAVSPLFTPFQAFSNFKTNCPTHGGERAAWAVTSKRHQPFPVFAAEPLIFPLCGSFLSVWFGSGRYFLNCSSQTS